MAKVKVIVSVEVADADSAPGLIGAANELIQQGYVGGSLHSEDNDYVSWSTNRAASSVGE